MSTTKRTAGKRLLSLGLSVLLAFGTMPTAAYADELAGVEGEGGTLIESQNEECLGLPGDAVLQENIAAGDSNTEDDSTSAALEEQDAAVEVQSEEEAIVVDGDSDDEGIAVEVQANSAGPTFASAYDVHVNDFFNYWYYDYLNASSKDDFFKFYVPSAGKVTFNVVSPQGPGSGGNGIGKGVHIDVFNNANNSSRIANGYINQNYSLNTISGSYEIQLTKGTYWIRVSADGWIDYVNHGTNRSSTNAPSTGGYYELRPSFASANESFVENQNGSNNTKATASGPVSFGKTYRGHVSVNDKEDYYRFDVTAPGRVTFKFGGISSVSRYVFDTTNGSGGFYQSGGHLSQGLNKVNDTTYYGDYSKGTYYLKIEAGYFSTYGTFTFKLSYAEAKQTFPEAQFGSNNSIASANAITFNKTYYGQVSATDYKDFYAFTVGANRKVSIVMTPLNKYLEDCWIYVSDYYGSFNEGTRHFKGVYTVEVPYSYSTYYMRVETDQWNYDTGAYSFRLYDGEVEDMQWVGVGSINYKYYTGQAIKPRPQVTYNGSKLTLNKDYKLSYKNNKKTGTATVTVTGINGFYGTKKATFKIIKPTVSYRTWIQGKAWKQKWKKNGSVAGITGEGRYIRYFKAELSGVRPEGGIQYIVNTEYAGSGSGWSTNWRQQWVSNGYAAGNDKQRIETIRIALYGEMKSYYNVYYRVHAQGYGWMGWTRNGGRAGTEGLGKRVEAIQVVLVKKGGKAPGTTYKGAKRNYKKAYVSR